MHKSKGLTKGCGPSSACWLARECWLAQHPQGPGGSISSAHPIKRRKEGCFYAEGLREGNASSKLGCHGTKPALPLVELLPPVGDRWERTHLGKLTGPTGQEDGAKASFRILKERMVLAVLGTNDRAIADT